MSLLYTHQLLWDRMNNAEQRVQERLERVIAAIGPAGTVYAVCGGLAVRAWVAQVDQAAVRATRDVDLLIRRADLDTLRLRLETAGFTYRHSANIDMFIDASGSPRDAVHIVFAGERVRPDHPEPAPDPADATEAPGFRLLNLLPLVRMKLNAFRDKDRVHLRDLIDVGLISTGTLAEITPALADRLRWLLNNPE